MTLENAAFKAANHGYAKYKQIWKRILQLAWGPDPKQFTAIESCDCYEET